MTLQLSLRQNGNNLNGSITNPFGSGTLPIRGSVSGNYINFSTQSQYGANNQLQFSGAIDRDNMQGSATVPTNNNASNGGGYPGGYPGGGYPGGYPGGGYPGGGGGRRRTGSGGTAQVHWNAQRN